jgi:predicted ArsR family transcriptional regulator
MYKKVDKKDPPHAGSEALGHPVRVAIVRRLLAYEDASLDELAEHARVHRNTVRAHAASLEAGGLLDRFQDAGRRGRGRPQTRYRLTPDADLLLASFRAVSQLLSGALSAAGVDTRMARRLGHELGRTNVRRRRGTRWSHRLEQELAKLGFSAHVDEAGVVLRRCPCPGALAATPELVCSLVRGFADGALEGLGTAHRVSDSDSDHDPERRRCLLPLRHRDYVERSAAGLT